MGNCAVKPKVLTETGAPAPEQPNEPLLEDQMIDTAKSLGHLLQEDKDETTMSEPMKQKPPETGDKPASTTETSKQELPTETKPPRVNQSPKVQETVDDLEKIQDKKVVEDLPRKETEVPNVRAEDEKGTKKEQNQQPNEVA